MKARGSDADFQVKKSPAGSALEKKAVTWKNGSDADLLQEYLDVSGVFLI